MRRPRSFAPWWIGCTQRGWRWCSTWCDGTNDNKSWNCGVEGPTTDPDVLRLRARQQRSLLATLVLSAGVPLLLGGDEFGRTQRGNNNAYCQDNEISWFDWSTVDRRLLRFTTDLIALRRSHPVFRRRRFLTGHAAGDLRWFTPSGAAMTEQNWADQVARSIAVLIDGSADPDCSEDGTPLLDGDFLVLINAWWEPLTFTVPDEVSARCWQVLCDTFDPTRSEPPIATCRWGRAPLVICSSQADAAPINTGLA